ncbi:MAG: tetratricopeptide repeat protein [Woeseiaceae bacterium]|nr:tetratricopeptide repeat protein [Woeseiaceae bacterium]
MNRTYRMLTRIFVLILCGIFASGVQVYAQDEETERERRDAQKTKQAQAVSKEVYDRIQKAQEEIDADRPQEALKILNSLRSKDLTEYELQNVLNYIGFVYYNMEQVGKAIAIYEEMLRIPSMEEQIRKQTLYTLAQLATMEENYEKALRILDEWFVLETNPAPEPYILYAQNLYQVNRYADMIKPIETAMEVARKRDLEVKEDWYVLLNFAYFQQENYTKVRDIQKILLVNWPKKRYWFSLAGAYTELGEEQNLIAAYDAALTQGMLEKESEFVTMAQLYLQHEVPYKAAKLLEEQMEKGVVAKDAGNYRLLSQAWTLAAEDEAAIPALQQAARLSDEGELNLRLGNAYLNLGRYGDCEKAIEDGLRKGGIKSPDNAHISLGMCLYNQKKYRDAIAAFREASKTGRSRRIAGQWISVIEADIERNEQIRLAEAAAQKQQRALAARRRATDI